jgi:hypothetical protein
VREIEIEIQENDDHLIKWKMFQIFLGGGK